MEGGTGDLSSVLGRLLENPDALKSAMDIASKLKASGALEGIVGSGEYDGGQSAYNAEKKAPRAETASAQNRSAEAPKNSERAQRWQLLSAIRPYMSAARQEKIDTALKILKLMDLAEQLGVLGTNVRQEAKNV